MRRLRENTMPEAEISPTGTVLVEGHHVGELQGFRFTADQGAGGEDAKAVRSAAQKALASEFEARAERFAASGNNDIALGSDGVLRWIGAPIGTLVAGEDALKPRLVLLADEQLTGPARDKVAARADRFVNFQVELLLKPLVDMKNAEQLTGIARGIAFQLVEHFGLINRRDIAEEMRTLDQEGRAALRRLGVRFGAYHVFVPSLIKPAPAGLVTLLWALKNDGKDKPGFGDVVHALASGRTSIVIDPTYDKTFYRLAGYRNLGRRAVRVDILERLADLIRPATNWKPGLGVRPDGAYDGQAFMVTPPMMSILGATADDMEEILKGLGYRAEPKPAADVKAKLEQLDQAARGAAEAKAAAADAAAKAAQTVDADVSAEGEQAVDASVAAEAEPGPEPTTEVETAVDAAAEGESVDVGVDAVEVTEDVEEVQAAEATETGVEIAEVAASAEVAGEAVEATEPPAHGTEQSGEAIAIEGVETAPGTDATKAESEEPKPILLWRQARFDHRRDNRHHRGGRNAQGAGENNRQRSDREGADQGNNRERFSRDRFKGRANGEGGRPDRSGGKPQGERQDRRDGRPEWKGKQDGRRPEGKGGKPSFQAKPREERPVRFDPDSPFAKLAALRDQLKK